MTETLSGTVSLLTAAGMQPMADVAVSNGRAVVRTDGDGRFALPAADAERFIFLTQPTGLRPVGSWYHDRERNGDGSLDFMLEPAPERAMQPFSFAHITDLHISAHNWDIKRPRQDQLKIPQPNGKMLSLPVNRADDLAEDIVAICETTPVDLIIATGDLSNSGHPDEFAEYARAIARSPVPLVSMPGNHDYMPKGAGLKHYRDALGPSYFSFDWGGVHFFAWDWNGWLRWGDGYAQHGWAENDLRGIPAGMPVVLLTHDHMPQPFYDRFPDTNFIASFSGHWHTSRVTHDGRMPHFNTQTLCMGAIDYCPRGYRHVTIDDDTVHVETHTFADHAHHRGFTFRAVRSDGEVPAASADASPVELGAPWTTFQGDVRRTGCAAADISVPLAAAWRVPVGGALNLASPLIADGKVIVSVSQEDRPGGSVIALDAATGERLWETPVANSVKHTPAIADGRVAGITVSGELFALDLKTGELGWTAQVGDRQLSWMYRPLLIVDGTIYVGDDRTFGAYALDDGAERWVLRDFSRATPEDTWPSTSPAAWTGDAVVFGNTLQEVHLFCLDPATGARIWEHGDDSNASILAGPAIADDGTMIVQRLYAQVHALNGECHVQWAEMTDSLFSPGAPAVTADAVFIATGAGTVMRIDRATGERAWTWRCDPALTSMASYVRGGYSLVSSPVVAGDGVLIGGGDGRFRVLNAADGTVVWEYDLGAPVNSAPAVSGNAVVITVTDGTVACFTPVR